jgi:hypothetical protein
MIDTDERDSTYMTHSDVDVALSMMVGGKK